MAYKKKRSTRKVARRTKRRAAPRRKIARKPRKTVKGTDDYYNNPLLLLGLKRNNSTRPVRRFNSASTKKKSEPKKEDTGPTIGQMKNIARDMLVHNLAFPFAMVGLTDDEKSVDFVRKNFPGFYDDSKKDHDVYISKNNTVNTVLSWLDRQDRPGNYNSTFDKIGNIMLTPVMPKLKESVGSYLNFDRTPFYLNPSNYMDLRNIDTDDAINIAHDYVTGKHNLPDVLEDGLDYISDTIMNIEKVSKDAFANGIRVPSFVDDFLDDMPTLSIHDFVDEERTKKAIAEFQTGKPFSVSFKPKHDLIPLPDDWNTNPDYRMTQGPSLPKSLEQYVIQDIPEAARNNRKSDLPKGTVLLGKVPKAQKDIIPLRTSEEEDVDVFRRLKKHTSDSHWRSEPAKIVHRNKKLVRRERAFISPQGDIYTADNLPDKLYVNSEGDVESKAERRSTRKTKAPSLLGFKK